MSAEAEAPLTDTALTEPGLAGDAQPVSVTVRCPRCEGSNPAGARACALCSQALSFGAHPAGRDGADHTLVRERADADAERLGEETPALPLAIRPRGASQRPLVSSRPAFRSDRPPALEDDDDELPHQVADPLVGVIVADRYRIVELLGRGGMGIVYKVEHTRIGKLLAMKLLTGELSQSPDVVRRFKQEALTSSKLSSPNTVQVFDFGASDRLTYLVMELVNGEDLGRVLRAGGPMPFDRLGPIVAQMCSSLAEAHTKGIVHRDIKPENVMLVRGKDGADIAKVLDFGLAKLRDGPELNALTSQGAIVGTPYFMSPEQVRGEAVDARSDIYAMGALMYRALTGHYPFNGPTPMAVFTKHLTEAAVPPAERAPELEIPAGVSAIVMKAIAKEPIDRFARAEELRDAIVAELLELGATSSEDAFDSAAVRDLARIEDEAREGRAAASQPAAEIATRDEVEAYERKLRRKRWGLLALVVAAVGAGGYALAELAIASRTPVFEGAELEPNNTAGDATLVPFGAEAAGYLGKRLDPSRGDRDFYAYDVPAGEGGSALVSLRVSALPNFAMCTLLYRQGFSTPLAQYCTGRAAKDLVIPALRIEPGRYLVAIMQDMDPYGAPTPPFVHENVSDPYVVSLARAAPDAADEIEPDDQVASAVPIAEGAARRGALAWARDEDVFCADAAAGSLRFRVRDVVRAAGTVLEATPMLGNVEGAAVRVHATRAGAPTPTDVVSPWTSDPIAPAADGAPRCVRLRLTNDPWTSGDRAIVPTGGGEAYGVEVIAP
jgi:serine/threonine-protein kinase